MMSFPPNNQIAPLHNRYVGLYHFSTYWGKWDKVISVDNGEWTVQSVDLDGEPTGPVRTHWTPMDARLFADKPFPVTRKDLLQAGYY